ncbi:uncharacterized protein LOC135101545 [Scylla paramamosain]|uniref:uncharacterized protein LOC135101545 n=1 Tax=Scylla paramamosain TaxID=85552 RepID=UPI0030839B35
MLAVVVVAAVWTLPCILAWRPSVHYFPTNAWGVHLLAPGRTLNPQDAYTNLTVRSVCSCKLSCKDDDRCVAASTSGSGGRELSCLLSNKGPTETTVSSGNETNYFYWFDSLPATDFGVKEDGLLYLVGKVNVNFTDARIWCSKIPGYRLAIFKRSIQFSMAVQIGKASGKQLWLDLEVTRSSSLIWGDGTNFDDTPFSHAAKKLVNNGGRQLSAMRVRGANLDDRYRQNLCHPLCQANPSGIIW